MSLVSTDWVEKNLNYIKIIDCSWHMPSTKRNGFDEYKKQHIKNALFFDLDKNSKKNTDLPHMLTDKKSWEKIVSEMGIKNKDRVVIYDNSDVISACRCWYNFIYFGHNPKLVHVLDGGLKKWSKEKKELTKDITLIKKTNYSAQEYKELVKNKKEIDKNIFLKKFQVVDARSMKRFQGKMPEPRDGLKSGSIPNSVCLPFAKVINEDNTFKNIKILTSVFTNTLRSKLTTNVVFSCGSGVTASVLALAYSLIHNKYKPKIYDGSWSEYGKI